ncbi:MAG: hypothetical protein ACKVPX_15945 [Myxococcaceae bacterium]
MSALAAWVLCASLVASDFKSVDPTWGPIRVGDAHAESLFVYVSALELESLLEREREAWLAHGWVVTVDRMRDDTWVLGGFDTRGGQQYVQTFRSASPGTWVTWFSRALRGTTPARGVAP